MSEEQYLPAAAAMPGKWAISFLPRIAKAARANLEWEATRYQGVNHYTTTLSSGDEMTLSVYKGELAGQSEATVSFRLRMRPKDGGGRNFIADVGKGEMNDGVRARVDRAETAIESSIVRGMENRLAREGL